MRVRCPLLAVVVLLSDPDLARPEDKPEALVHTRSLDEIKRTLGTILAAGDQKADEKLQALRRLKAYRYLVEVPYEDLTLDEDYNTMCQAGVKLCERLGKLEHTPKNPGLPEEEFRIAYNGTSRSNLAWGDRTLVQSVDAWMFDSDAANIDRLGHRRWCLHPAMQKTGFGHAGLFTAMYTVDRSRRKLADFDFICFPAKGYMPIDFFGPRQAWSVTLNPQKYKTPARDYGPKIYQADAAGRKHGEPLKLDFRNVDTVPFGIPNCIIFRPENLKLRPGERFIVELEGIVPRDDEHAVTLRYPVDFVN